MQDAKESDRTAADSAAVRVPAGTDSPPRPSPLSATAARFAHLSVGIRTDVGRRRRNNEDSYGSFPAVGVFCVADGMGGAADGEVASRVVVEHFSGALPRWEAFDPPLRQSDRVAVLRLLLDSASLWIKEYADAQGKNGCGSTFAGVCFDPSDPARAVAVHAGDSRVYRIRGAEIRQITRDHSLENALADQERGSTGGSGFGSPKERVEALAAAGYSNLVMRAVGIREAVSADETPFDVAAGDWVLVCSDGLTRMVPDADIAAVLGDSKDAEAAADSLVALANRRGGKDNVTVVAIRVGPLPGPSPVQSPLSETDRLSLLRGKGAGGGNGTSSSFATGRDWSGTSLDTIPTSEFLFEANDTPGSTEDPVVPSRTQAEDDRTSAPAGGTGKAKMFPWIGFRPKRVAATIAVALVCSVVAIWACHRSDVPDSTPDPLPAPSESEKTFLDQKDSLWEQVRVAGNTNNALRKASRWVEELKGSFSETNLLLETADQILVEFGYPELSQKRAEVRTKVETFLSCAAGATSQWVRVGLLEEANAIDSDIRADCGLNEDPKVKKFNEVVDCLKKEIQLAKDLDGWKKEEQNANQSDDLLSAWTDLRKKVQAECDTFGEKDVPPDLNLDFNTLTQRLDTAIGFCKTLQSLENDFLTAFEDESSETTNAFARIDQDVKKLNLPESLQRSLGSRLSDLETRTTNAIHSFETVAEVEAAVQSILDDPQNQKIDKDLADSIRKGKDNKTFPAAVRKRYLVLDERLSHLPQNHIIKPNLEDVPPPDSPSDRPEEPIASNSEIPDSGPPTVPPEEKIDSKKALEILREQGFPGLGLLTDVGSDATENLKNEFHHVETTDTFQDCLNRWSEMEAFRNLANECRKHFEKYRSDGDAESLVLSLADFVRLVNRSLPQYIPSLKNLELTPYCENVRRYLSYESSSEEAPRSADPDPSADPSSSRP